MQAVEDGFRDFAEKGLSAGKTPEETKTWLESVNPGFLTDAIFQGMFLTVAHIVEIERENVPVHEQLPSLLEDNNFVVD